MSEDGTTKDDVKVPDGEVGDKINKLFTEESKDTSKIVQVKIRGSRGLTTKQTLSFLLLWVRRLPLTPRRLPLPNDQMS
jgi:hypothetical protein